MLDANLYVLCVLFCRYFLLLPMQSLHSGFYLMLGVGPQLRATAGDSSSSAWLFTVRCRFDQMPSRLSTWLSFSLLLDPYQTNKNKQDIFSYTGLLKHCPSVIR